MPTPLKLEKVRIISLENKKTAKEQSCNLEGSPFISLGAKIVNCLYQGHNKWVARNEQLMERRKTMVEPEKPGSIFGLETIFIFYTCIQMKANTDAYIKLGVR